MKVPVITRDEYQVTLEPHAGVLWVHCDVKSFSLSTIKDMDKSWDSLLDLLRADLYVLYNPKTQIPSKSFISRYGFKKLKDIVDKQGNLKEIWKMSYGRNS